jgi:S-adenosylmethionine hydrolase
VIMSIITLLTDFGTKDEYVGLMKGVILSINPSAAIVDITHQIAPQNIVQAAFSVHASYRYFPEGSVHLIVVDPGVGMRRDLLVLKMRKHLFVAPDNGVLTLLLGETDITALVRLTNSNFFLNSVSRTFQGRDIIAPVGAHLSKGIDLRNMGEEVDPKYTVRLDDLGARTLENGRIIGKIVVIDHFGNLISNIESQKLAVVDAAGRKKRITIKIGSHLICGLSETYGSVPPQAPLALIGSRGYLEIALNQGSAGQFFNARPGDTVEVII